MIFVAWFEILVGIMVVALRISLLVTREVPELAGAATSETRNLATDLPIAAGTVSCIAAVTRSPSAEPRTAPSGPAPTRMAPSGLSDPAHYPRPDYPTAARRKKPRGQDVNRPMRPDASSGVPRRLAVSG